MSTHAHQRPVRPMELGIVVTQQRTTSVIELDGEWDLAAREATRTAIRRVLARGPSCVVLDLTRVSFIDASGVHVVVELARHSAADHVYLVIVPGPPAVQRVFALCRVIGELPFVADGGLRDRPAPMPPNPRTDRSPSRHQRRPPTPDPHLSGRRRAH